MNTVDVDLNEFTGWTIIGVDKIIGPNGMGGTATHILMLHLRSPEGDVTQINIGPWVVQEGKNTYVSYLGVMMNENNS